MADANLKNMDVDALLTLVPMWTDYLEKGVVICDGSWRCSAWRDIKLPNRDGRLGPM